MKKAKMLLILLLVFASFQVYAGDVPMDFTTKLDFRCTTSWGWNLDTNATGFDTVINWLALYFSPTGWKTLTNDPGVADGQPHMFFSITGLDLTIINYAEEYGTASPTDTTFGNLNLFNLEAKLVFSPLWVGIICQGDPKQFTWDYDKFISDKAFVGARTTFQALSAGGLPAALAYGSDWRDPLNWVTKYRDLFQATYFTYDNVTPHIGMGRVLIGYDNDSLSLIGKLGSLFPGQTRRQTKQISMHSESMERSSQYPV